MNPSLKRFALVLAVLALLAFPVAVPNPYNIHLMVVIGIYAILLFGLDIVVGYAGELALGHAGLFGLGAYTAGVLATTAGWPVYATIPAAIAVAALAGVLLALPALRVSGPYLAMATLAFGSIIQILLNEMDFVTNGPRGLQVLKPVLAGHALNVVEYYYFVLFLFGLSLLAINRLLRSRVGRAFEALRGSPVASDCMGVSVYRYKVLAFVISAAYAGLAGALFAYSEEYIAPNSFGGELTILFLLALILGGSKTRSGALLGAAIVVLLPNLLSDLHLFRGLTVAVTVFVTLWIGLCLKQRRMSLRQVALPLGALFAFVVYAFSLQEIIEQRLTIFGLMVLGVIYYLPDGIMGFVHRTLRRVHPAWYRPSPTHTAGGNVATGHSAADWGNSPDATRHPEGAEVLLAAQGIIMQFGGLKAINNVDLQVRRGVIHGLIGPNGSGKSTMMNVLTGIYTPTAGKVLLAGRDITGHSSASIALAGIARTFQNIQLFGSMNTIDSVLVGLNHAFQGSLAGVMLATPAARREELAAQEKALRLLSFVGLAELAYEEARSLPYGKQRLLEIARALALAPQLLLLDEPAAGLTAPEISELVAMIRKIRDHGITVILIEHHMDIVMGVCDRISVLDFGQKIAEGTPDEVRCDPRVIEAYLGGSSTEQTDTAAVSDAVLAGAQPC